jgi:predicted dehydrogenase
MVVKVGMIGCGTISRYHLKQIQALGSAELVAAYNRSPGLREDFGRESGLASSALYSDVNEMLRHPGLNAVVNCLPNRMHSGVSVTAMEAGLHVLCEKPMATSVDEARQMLDAAKRNDVKLVIGLTLRFRGKTVAAKQVVEKGVLGDVYYAKAGWMRRNGIPGWGSQFTRQDLAGAGPIYDIGVHALDTTCWLMSDFKADQVLASSYAKLGPSRKGLGDWGVPNLDGYFDVEDLSSAVIKMKSGATIAFEVSWAANIPKTQFTVRLMGEKAGVDLESMKVHSTGDSELDEPIEFTPTDAYYEEMKHFVDCIQGGKEPITTPCQMLELQATLDMILMSSKENRVVKRNEV